MASSNSLLPALAGLLLLFATVAHSQHLSVDEYCQKAAFQQLCKELNHGHIESPIQAEIALVELTIEKLKGSVLAADEVGKALGGGDMMKIVYECKNNYRDTIEDLNTVLSYLKGRGTDQDVNISLSSALTNIDNCDTEWMLKGYNMENRHPLAQENWMLIMMLSNALSLGNELKGYVI